MKKWHQNVALFRGSNAFAAVLFVCFFLYLWLRVEPVLRYRYAAPPFIGDNAFFGKHLGYPGGPLEYAAAFLTQLDYYDWLGSITATILAMLVFGCLRLLFRSQAIPGQEGGVACLKRLIATVVPFLPPLILLLLWNAYDSPVLMAGVGYLASLGFSLGYGLFPGKAFGVRCGLCWLLSAGLFCLAGTWPCLLLVSFCALFEVRSRRPWLAAGCLAASLVAVFWGGFSAAAPPASIFKAPTTGWVFQGCLALYLVAPVAGLVLGGIPKPQALPVPASPSYPGHGSCRCHRAEQVLLVMLLLCGFTAVWLTFDGPRKNLIRIDRWADLKQWDKVLNLAVECKNLNPSAKINVARALYHTGRFSEGFFSFPSLRQFNFLPGFEGGQVSLFAQSMILYELGQVNVAERFAHEALSCEGERPEILKHLARIHVLKGHPKAAEVFLNVLRKTPFHARFAQKALDCLRREGDWTEAREISDIQTRRVATDLPGSTVPAELLLRQLLQGNNRNRMAYDFLMVQYLLTRELNLFLKNLARSADFGIETLPRHYAEALLLSRHLQNTSPPALRERQVDPEISANFDRFVGLLNRGEIQTPEGRQSLERDFGHTYWFYFWLREMENPQSTTP